MKTDAGIYAQGLLHLVLIVGFTLGLYGRSLTWLLALVNLGLMQRNMSVVYGADLFTNFWLFYLSFVNHNQYFSLWNVICKNRKIIQESDLVSTMGIRLLQAQLCLSYAYTGLEKFKGIQWWEGSAIWHVIGIDAIITRDFSFLQNVPTLVATLCMLTVIFEVYFIFAVWNKRLKYPWLLVGLVFHLSTGFFMELWFFGFIMVAPYILFLPDLSK
ncbi:MAG: HTTM domain-containing protein, partial [Bdellovibrionales bacterium]|nr:HTTM domain-containing protein [Bdellovibrionales bacterium]